MRSLPFMAFLLAAAAFWSAPPLARLHAQTKSADTSTSAGEVRRVRLQPVLRKSESAVRLNPVIRQTPAPTPKKPKAAAKPKPQPQAAVAAKPAPAPSAAPAPKPERTTVVSSVRQPPLGDPLPPGQQPPRSASTARAPHRLAAGRALLDKGEVDAGRRLLFQLATEIPGTPQAAEALLLAALALDDIDQTKQELREIVRVYPSGDVTRVALSRMGELNFIVGNYGESISAYRDFRKIAETQDQRRQADLRIAIALLRSEQYAEANKALTQVAADYPELRQTPELLEAQGDSLMAIGNLRDASARFDDLQRGFPNYESAVKVLMNRGLCAELLGDSATARREYTRITQDFPGSIEASLAAGRLADLQAPLLTGAVD